MANLIISICATDLDVLLDPEGRELAARLSRRSCAGRGTRDHRRATQIAGHIDLDQNIEVSDAAGAIVHRVAFEDAVHRPEGGRILVAVVWHHDGLGAAPGSYEIPRGAYTRMTAVDAPQR